MPALETMVEVTAARQQAAQNFRANYQAMEINQPAVAAVLAEVELNLEWVFARDGSLTALHPDGEWWAKCSVPTLAGRSLLKTLDSMATGSCLLAPVHAGLVTAACSSVENAALFVIQGDLETARMILCCHDFSDLIAEHRFWLACGPDWNQQFDQLFNDHPGLATPTRFIRTRLTEDEVILPLIKQAQDVFAAVLVDRAEKMSSMRELPSTAVDPRRVLLIGGSAFRLWDDGPQVLGTQLTAAAAGGDLRVRLFDTDRALSQSPLALLQAVENCGSVVSANLCRADSNHLVSPEIPWITWITQPGVPSHEFAGRRDGLILADAKWRTAAQKAGWPTDRVRVCGWPGAGTPSAAPVKPMLAIICNTLKISIPMAVQNFSSHRLLWELVEEELAGDPLAVENPIDYLKDRAGQLDIAIDALDQQSFIYRLIVPAYQQGLARALIANRLPVALWGNGWSDMAEFAPQSRGCIGNPAELKRAVDAASALIYCWPDRSVHPMDSTGKPIVHRSGREIQTIIGNARRALEGKGELQAVTHGLGRTVLEMIGID